MARRSAARLLLVSLAAVVFGGAGCGRIESRIDDALTVTPAERFEEVTGRPLPPSAMQLDETADYTAADGSSIRTFEMSAADVEALLAAPVDVGPWQAGPVVTGDMWPGIVSGLIEFGADSTVGDRLLADDVTFAADERCCSERGSLEWWNATVVVVDETNDHIHLVSWDY